MELRTYLSFPREVVASIALILRHSDYQRLLTTNNRHSRVVTRNLVPRQIRSGRTEIGSQNWSALLISVRPGALQLNQNLNYSRNGGFQSCG